MRLHLPKALLAAVLAACLAWPAGAEGEDTSTITTVTITQQSDLTTNHLMSTAVSALQQGDLLIFNSSSALSLPKYADDTTKAVAMPMDIRIDKNLLISDGYSGTVYNFSGSISGTANFTSAISTTASNQTYNFSGSLANFTGALSLSNKVTTTFQNVGTVGATSISLAGSTTLTGSFSTSGNLTNTGTLTNNGSLTIASKTVNGETVVGSYTGGTITQGSSASLILDVGAIVNLDSIASTNSLTNTEVTGIQAYSTSWALASGGTVNDNGALYKVGGNSITGGTMSSTGTFTLTSYYYNVASNTSKSYSEVTTDIGTNSVDFINVLGTLTGISDSTKNYAIKGDGIIQVSGSLQYHEGTFLNDFTGTMEIGNEGFLKLGNTQNRLGNLSAIKVTEGGKIGGWGTAKPSNVTLNLSGGILTTAGGNLTYSGAIIVTADSFLTPDGAQTLTVSGNITNQNNAGITSTGTVTMVGGTTTLGNITVQSGSLNLGMVSGNKYASKDISVGDVTVNAGATFSVGYTKGTVKSVSLAAGSILRYYDNVSETEITNPSDTTNITSLRVNAAANTAAKLQADWKGTLNISELTGAGDLALSKEESAYNPYFFLNISSIKDYSGTITGPSENASFMTVTIGGADISDAASTATVSADVTLKAGFTKTGAGAVSFGGTTNATDVTVSSGSLTFAGETSISKLSLNGGTTTISGATTVSGVKENGIIAADGIKLTISDKGTLTHDGFKYTETELSGLSHGLTMWNANNEHRTETYNVKVSGGTLTQTATGEKGIYAALENVKLINGSGTKSTLGVNADLSGADIKGTLSINETTTTTIKNTFTDSTGATTSTIATLTGSGTLKTTGGTTEVTNASGFSGTLAATGGNIELQSAAALALSEVVVAGGSSITVGDTVTDVLSISASKVSIGEEGGSLVGNLSIKDNGTITLDATDGQEGTGLNLGGGDAVTMAEGTTTTGSLTLGSGLTLNLLNINLKQNQSLTLFSGVTGVTGIDDMVALKSGSLEANTVFTNLTAGDFNLSFDETNHIVAIVAQRNVPEPTTATLSLLALMGLAARRRRRKA